MLMGTASLAIGIGLMVAGVSILIIFEPDPNVKWYYNVLGKLIIAIPIMVLGAFFIREYDKDKKKSNIDNI